MKKMVAEGPGQERMKDEGGRMKKMVGAGAGARKDEGGRMKDEESSRMRDKTMGKDGRRSRVAFCHRVRDNTIHLGTRNRERRRPTTLPFCVFCAFLRPFIRLCPGAASVPRCPTWWAKSGT